MGAFSFVIRTMILTVLIVLLLQIRWGDSSLEDVTMNFITSSAVVAPINQSAQGTVRFIRNLWTKANRSFDTHFSRGLQDENRPGSRHLGFSLERSEKVLKQDAEKVKEKAEDAYEEAKDSSAFQKFKESARSASSRVKSSFVDETKDSGSADR
jgi:hypothetical protein